MTTSPPDTDPVPIRMSSAGHCPRQQAYASLGYQATDPPDRQAENRMALGDAAENILIHNLTTDGWHIRHTRAVAGGEQLSVGLHYPAMTGHPDGVCRHPIHTEGRRLTLECKSMSSDRLRQVEQDGIPAVFPDYLAQVAFYSRILYELDFVDEPRQAVFAYMDREGNQPAPELVRWDADYEQELRRRVTDTWEQICEGQLPARPYPADDPRCRYCRFFSLCQGQMPDWRDLPRPQTNDDPAVIAAARQWVEANEQRNAAKAVLQAACPDPESAGVMAGEIIASWFLPKRGDYYDTDLLRRWLTADQMRAARRKDRAEPAFWIRPQRR